MACDICGKRGWQLVDLLDSHKTPESHQICDECLTARRPDPHTYSREDGMMDWQPMGRDIHALVDADGKVLAEVHGTHNYGIYYYKDAKYVSLAQAKAAAERSVLSATPTPGG
jgi:hypothetical protein